MNAVRTILLLFLIKYTVIHGEDANKEGASDILKHENFKLLPEDCGLIDVGDKIRGGQNANLGEFPWMALLSYKTYDGPKFQCGGTIINDRYILTAAHCIVYTRNPIQGVRVGEYSLLSEKDCDEEHPNICLPPPQDLTIEKTIAHPEYNNISYANDIALIRVSKIDLGPENINTICLPVYEDVITQKYSAGVVTGWGLIDPFGINAIDKLQKVLLKRRNITTCITAYKLHPDIKPSDKQICVGGEGVKDSCQGDSGGPFLVPTYLNDDDRYVQHGIVSVGHHHCGTPGFPAIYTKVVSYAKWILDNIQA